MRKGMEKALVCGGKLRDLFEDVTANVEDLTPWPCLPDLRRGRSGPARDLSCKEVYGGTWRALSLATWQPNTAWRTLGMGAIMRSDSNYWGRQQRSAGAGRLRRLSGCQ